MGGGNQISPLETEGDLVLSLPGLPFRRFFICAQAEGIALLPALAIRKIRPDISPLLLLGGSRGSILGGGKERAAWP